MNYFILIILSALFQSIAGVCSKYAAIASSSSPFLFVVFNKFYIVMIISLVLQAVVWSLALKKHSLVYAYPFMSLSYIFTYIFANIFFKETITLPMMIGMLFILMGLILLRRSTCNE